MIRMQCVCISAYVLKAPEAITGGCVALVLSLTASNCDITFSLGQEELDV